MEFERLLESYQAEPHSITKNRTRQAPQIDPPPAHVSSNGAPKHIPLEVNYSAEISDLQGGRRIDAPEIVTSPVKKSKTERIKSIFRGSTTKNAVPAVPGVRVVMPPVVEPGSQLVGQDRVRDDDQRPVLGDPEECDLFGKRVFYKDSAWVAGKTRRSVVIDLKHEPTYSEISTVCKDTGKLESIEIYEINNYAKVRFLKEEDAARFMEIAKSEITYAVADSDYKRAMTKLIDVRYNWPVDDLPDDIEARIAADDITRCVTIRGITRPIMAHFLGIEDNFGKNNNKLLWHFANNVVSSAYKKVEGVQVVWISEAWECVIVYTDIFVAIEVLDFMKKDPQFSRCSIWFGVDPCEPLRVPHAM